MEHKYKDCLPLRNWIKALIFFLIAKSASKKIGALTGVYPSTKQDLLKW